MFDALARLADHHRRLVLIVAGVFVVFAAAYGGPVVGLLDSNDDFEDHQSESVLARADVERATGHSAAPDMAVLVRAGAPVDSPAAQRKIAAVANDLKDPGVADVVAYKRGGPRALVSRDGRSTYLLVTFRSDADDKALADRLADRLNGEPGVAAGGGQVAFSQVSEQVQEDLKRAEMLAFPLLFLLSLVVFRSVVAALLPVIVGATAILTTFVWLRLVNTVEPMSVFAINLITGAGLGLAIDYSLFVVSRFREELATRPGRSEALLVTHAHRRAHGAVQRRDRRGRDGLADRLPPALPVLDGVRRRARGADRRARLAHRAAGAARRPRPARERAQPQALAGRDHA